MTEEIKKKIRDELNTLDHELAFDIPKEIKKAVAMGDLSENAEYHTAKQRQEYLKARVRQLGKRLAELSLADQHEQYPQGQSRPGLDRDDFRWHQE
jgi:transcription elongation factor GreA